MTDFRRFTTIFVTFLKPENIVFDCKLFWQAIMIYWYKSYYLTLSWWEKADSCLSQA